MPTNFTYPSVVVLYADLSTQRVLWADRATLQRNEVLSIALVHPNEPLKYKRHQAKYELDWYILTWDATHSHLGGWNDDFFWFRFEEPWGPYENGYVFRYPYTLPVNSIVFEGAMVAPEVYEQAKLILDDRNGPMF